MLTIFGFHTDDKLYTKHAQILTCSAKNSILMFTFIKFLKMIGRKLLHLNQSSSQNEKRVNG